MMRIHLQRERYSVVPIFAGMRMEEVQEILAITGEARFEPGERITQEGQEGDEFYILLEGRVEIRKRMPNDAEETIALLEAGSVFGESCIMDNRTRSSSAVVMEPAIVSTIRKVDFESFVKAGKLSAYKVLANLLRIVSDRLRKMNDLVTQLIRLEQESKEITRVIPKEVKEISKAMARQAHA